MLGVRRFQRFMSKGLILSCMVSLAMLGGGYWLGARRTIQTAPSTANEGIKTESSSSATPPLPAARYSYHNNSAVVAAGGKLSLTEIEDKIRELNANLAGFGDREFMKMLDSVDRADFPQLLAFIDKHTPRNLRPGLRQMLVSRWAETDLPGALTYVQSIPHKLEREAALGALVQGWAGNDAGSQSCAVYVGCCC